MRRLLLLLLLPGLAAASEGAVALRHVDVDLRDAPSLQRGARLYVGYCLGCHSLRFQRYERTADDLGIPHDVALETLVPKTAKIGDLMVSAVPPASKNWFGAAPPDLTMVARVRNPNWLFTYLTGFYLDETRPFGVNNALFENVAMPHVLQGLQGIVRKICAPAPGKAVAGEHCASLVHEAGSGALTPAEYDASVRDIVNFLYYVGEPSRLDRERIGTYVLLFLVVMFMLAWLLNREYWKDIH